MPDMAREYTASEGERDYLCSQEFVVLDFISVTEEKLRKGNETVSACNE